MVTAERTEQRPRLRGFGEFIQLPELPRTNIIISSDVEGPMVYLDFIDKIMAERIRKTDGTHPELDEVQPSYGHEIYNSTYVVFNEVTANKRRPNLVAYKASLSQECEDTLFAIPLLLAVGVTETDLYVAAFKSNLVPGAKKFYDAIQNQYNIPIFGVTSAFQDPYRQLMQREKIIPPDQLFGSPMPLKEMKRRLEEEGVFEEEMQMVRDYIHDCINFIDDHSNLEIKDDHIKRVLTEEGRQMLNKRIKTFLFEEIGLTYDPDERRKGPAPTVIGQVLEEHRVLGDRSKLAITKALAHRYLTPGGVAVTQGDGLNDCLNLQASEMSLGINSTSAAKAAKIAIVTPTMENLMPIYQSIIKGERNPSVIVKSASRELGSKAIVHLGGENIDPGILEAHRKMKEQIRGPHLIY